MYPVSAVASRGTACYVLAHGNRRDDASVHGCGRRRTRGAQNSATLRFSFLCGRGQAPGHRSRPATVRAATAAASQLASGLPLSQAASRQYATRGTDAARCPVCGASPSRFASPGRPTVERGEHLFDVRIPMLFLQGTRDEFADPKLLQSLVERLGARATLKLLPDADHSFHVPARTGRKEPETRADMLDALARWIDRVID
jgi:predicted alpha/beta-hydrolase family hydrolase